MFDKVFRILLGWAIFAIVLISTAPGCLVTCNPPEAKEKPIEEIQAHPLTRKYTSK